MVVWNPACRHHYAGAGHPERPQRFEAVIEALRHPDLASAIRWIEASPAPRSSLERVHPASYIDMLEAMDARGCARALIVDWDVHHGNGTQALVERDPTIRFVSMHQYPWYPGTGTADERGVGNVFNVPRPGGLPRAVYVRDFLAGVDVALADWDPDILLISAGFDSLAGDPLGEFTLEPDDITHWTEALRARMGKRPVVGVLEGGYRLDLLAAGVVALVRALS